MITLMCKERRDNYELHKVWRVHKDTQNKVS